MTHTFDLIPKASNGFAGGLHPDALLLTLDRTQAKRLIEQLLERMDDEPFAVVKLFGTKGEACRTIKEAAQ